LVPTRYEETTVTFSSIAPTMRRCDRSMSPGVSLAPPLSCIVDNERKSENCGALHYGAEAHDDFARWLPSHGL
jgi:hypothetical protein